jgi:hypothetical protein
VKARAISVMTLRKFLIFGFSLISWDLRRA